MARMAVKASLLYRAWDEPTDLNLERIDNHREDDGAPTADHRGLWQAVVLQAFRDACMSDPPADWKHRWSTLASSSTANIPTIRDRARTWLLENGNDFADVCGFADLDPDAVRAAARRMLRDEKSVQQANKFFTRERTPSKDPDYADMPPLPSASELFGRGQFPKE